MVIIKKKAKELIFKQIKKRNPTYDFYEPYLNQWEKEKDGTEVLKPLTGKIAEPFFLELGCNVFRNKKTGEFSIDFCEKTEEQIKKGIGKENSIIITDSRIKTINKIKKNPDLEWYATFHTHPPLSTIIPSIKDIIVHLDDEFMDDNNDNWKYSCVGNSAKNYNMICFQVKPEILNKIENQKDFEKLVKKINKTYEEYKKEEEDKYFYPKTFSPEDINNAAKEWSKKQKEEWKKKTFKEKLSIKIFKLRNRKGTILSDLKSDIVAMSKKTGNFYYARATNNDAYQILKAREFKRKFKDIIDIKIYSEKR